MSRGLLIVLSAPSGCGKTTMLKMVMAKLPGLLFSVSHTTRKPRAGEENGHDYFFVSRQEFENMRDASPSGFLEWAEVYGNSYGTGRENVQKQRGSGFDVILDIDVQGAAQVCAVADPITIFIAPPSLAELERRLTGRGTENKESITRRLDNAKNEMAVAGFYDYLIVNDDLDTAVESLSSILIAERLRRGRNFKETAVALL
jgi:guanylate kinase